MFDYALMSSIANLSVQQLRRAVTLKEKIQSLEKKLSQLLGSTSSLEAEVQAPKKKKFTMSAAAKAKISAAATARWARVKGAAPAVKAVKAVKKGKRTMSAAAKAKISAKIKKAWALRKAAKK